MIRRLLVAASAALLVLAMVGVVSAAIPNSSTKVYVACMDRYGKIRLIDHQAGARCLSSEKTLTWNQRGPVGPQGPTGATGDAGSDGADGAPGPTGAPGKDGISGYERVSGEPVVSNSSAALSTATATCPAGKNVIGGGYSVSAEVETFTSQPTSDSTWTVTADYKGGAMPWTLQAFAVCAAVAP